MACFILTRFRNFECDGSLAIEYISFPGYVLSFCLFNQGTDYGIFDNLDIDRGQWLVSIVNDNSGSGKDITTLTNNASSSLSHSRYGLRESRIL
jgi:hypothetical protein